MLEVYGAPLIEYTGTGELHFEEGGFISVSFKCIQLHDATIYIHAVSTKPEELIPLGLIPRVIFNVPQIKELKGVLQDGRNFKTTGWIEIANSKTALAGKPKFELLLLTEQMIIHNISNNSPAHLIKFALTNLRFIPTQKFNLPDGSEVLGTQLRIGNIEVYLLQDISYKEREIVMKRLKLCQVSARMDIVLDNLEIPEVVNIAADITTLISFANGTIINWPYYEVEDEEGNFIFVQHQMNMTSSFVSTAVIDQRSREELGQFVEKVYPKYLELKSSDQYDFANVLYSVVHTKLQEGFIEARALNIGSIVDVLRGKWANLHNRAFIIEKEIFENKTKLKPLKQALTTALQNIYSFDERQIKEAKEKIIELNRPSFAQVLKEMIKDVKANITDDEVDLFKNNRNELVHNGKFATDSSMTDFVSMFNFADRLVLALLNYKGYYLDCRNWQRILL